MSADYRILDRWDNGEFLTGCTLELVEDGAVVETHELRGSSEFPGPDAVTQAISLGESWVEAQTYTLEERLGPYGIEWQREQSDRAGV